VIKPNPSIVQMRDLWNTCAAWLRSNNVNSDEAIMQVDSIQEALPELAESVAKIVGYAEPEDSDDED
jgi:hypothetical protein